MQTIYRCAKAVQQHCCLCLDNVSILHFCASAHFVFMMLMCDAASVGRCAGGNRRWQVSHGRPGRQGQDLRVHEGHHRQDGLSCALPGGCQDNRQAVNSTVQNCRGHPSRKHRQTATPIRRAMSPALQSFMVKGSHCFGRCALVMQAGHECFK